MLNESDSTLQEIKKVQKLSKDSVLKSLNIVMKEKIVTQKGVLILNESNINALKAKERQAALVLEELSFKKLCWFTSDNAVKYYICPIESCSGYFLDLGLLKNHFFEIHNSRPYKCNFNNCKWSFTTKSKLERHKNSHLNLKWFRCYYEECSKMFTTVYNLRQHLKNVHENAEQFVCTVGDCNAAFHNQRSLDLHKGLHLDVSPSYRCNKEGCDKTFVTKNALCSHMRSHERKIEEVKCSWEGCNKIFDMPCRLREHMRTHTGEKPYRCDHPGCGWSFYSCSKLHRHKNKHLQIRKYVCCVNHCNKSFLRSQHLKEHIIRHSKSSSSKNFSCPVTGCDIKFNSKSVMYKHVKKIHRQENSQETNTANNLYSEYEMKLPNESPQQNFNTSMNQLDTVTLLAGEYDICPSENVPLTAQIPELMSSELLVAMTSIESSNNQSLVDINSIESSNNEGYRGEDIPSIEPSHHVELVFNESNIPFVLDNSAANKTPRKCKASSLGSARTNYTYDDVIREKKYRTELELNRRNKLNQSNEGNRDDGKNHKKVKNSAISKQAEEPPNCKLSIPPDLVLGAAGMSDPHSLIVKDELYTQEDLQVLLLDQSTVRNSIFEPSTINLRDLE